MVLANNANAETFTAQDHESALRVRPETSSGIAELSEHEPDGGEFEEGERSVVQVLPIFGEAAAAVEPGNGAFDDPAPRQDHEPFDLIRALDDFGF